ncbi:Crp/Fnr family transcriptional regulator [Cytophagaceae bacterium DM2B3-1]|uniref:Crp/Fnr family transcriptional regulator n=1 Tax=Xanthocytophaga flava TaxID=3048013 RepID=A0ABT7CCU3_9BACT|nr:Crp/Fnr family transcriptional regulator [Xanthocytophaga flavus]MDJ1491516.1 Crp/Fnr family transcriptional regulator [Xanthocytophaga flavus]
MELIQYLESYKPISKEDESLIAGAFERLEFKEGTMLSAVNQFCKKLYFICNGILRIVSVSEKGNDITHFFLKENYFCTITNSFNNQIVAQEGIQAATDVEVLAIGKEELSELYLQVPHIKEVIQKVMQETLLQKVQVRNTYQGLDATSRYKLFLMLQPEVAARVPLGYIASYLDITQQSLSRIRKNLSQSSYNQPTRP